MAGLCSLALVLAPLLATAAHAQDRKLEFAEAYALSEDRGKLLVTLLEGSPEWYEYSCRELQARGDFAAVPALLDAWIRRHGRGSAVKKIENRQALLSFAVDPKPSFAFLRQRLGVRFDDQLDAIGVRADLPTRLDAALISREAWSQRARAAHPNSLDGFTDSALFWLAQTELDERSLHALLKRLRRPDLPGLPELLTRELPPALQLEFGSLPIHSALRLGELEQCARLRPQLLNEPEFVAAWVARLVPGADSTYLHDPVELRQVLARVWDFAKPLPPVHNSLKAHVLYHLLALDLQQGAIDEPRFIEYLRLPRKTRHMPAEYRARFQAAEQVDPAREFGTNLPAIGDEDKLVRAVLQQIFARQEELEPFSEFLDAEWLRAILAETRLVNGDPDVSRWSAWLGANTSLEELAQRVEIKFPPSARSSFAALDAVVIEADVKNVPTLLVKVFAIDAFRYHVAMGKEIDEDIELDGLVANFEQRFQYDAAPLLRVRRRFELPILSQPGTFVVELVGNGLRSRALIRKGSLRFVETPGAAGHAFQVFDEAGARLVDAGVWTGGREYRADARGEIVVPFSTDPGEKIVVLRHGERSTRGTFMHLREEYALRAAFHVDREALVAGGSARLLARPELLLAGRPIALSLLEEPVLSLSAVDLDGLTTTQEVRGLALTQERELVHEFPVPERLASLSLGLRGSLQDLAGKRVELSSADQSFPFNGIDASAATSSCQFLRTSNGYALELRGKNGELRAGRPVELTLRARDFVDVFQVTLQTDAASRIELGALEGIAGLRVSASSFSSELLLRDAAIRHPASLHGLAGETLRVPYAGPQTSPTRAAFSLLGHERDAFEKLALEGGFLELRDLAAGDYELWLHETNTCIAVRVVQGRAQSGWLLGRERTLERTRGTPLALPSLELAGDELRIAVANPTQSTRLAVVATRYLPPFQLFESLGDSDAPAARAWAVGPTLSSYTAGTALGDEYRYVLERRFAPKYPGNMLARPSWLLNRLDLDKAVIAIGGGAAGKFGGRSGGTGRKFGGGAGSERALAAGPSTTLAFHPGVFANLDFLPAGSRMLANLAPDANGVVRVPLRELGAGQLVHVLALDGAEAVYRTLARPESPLVVRTRHLAAALDEREHSIERRRIEFVAATKSSVIDEARTAKVTRLDSLAAVHRLFLSISNDADLARFEFVVRWPELSRAQQLELYSRNACHELHFFLHQKDRKFFDEVVRPFLQNKLEKSFLDHWLLDDDLRDYLEPWAFGRLNLIEKILLARRVDAAERAAIVRRVSEAHALRPPDRERLQRLFETALASDSLGKSGDGETAGKPRLALDEPSDPSGGIVDEVLDSTAGETAEMLEHHEADAERRKDVRRLYQPVEPTLRYIEHDYWYRAPRADNSFADLVPASAFWRDFALADPAQPFVSTAVAEASTSFLEMLFALSVLDLPFKAGAVEVKREGTLTTLRPSTGLLLVRRETAPVGAAAAPSPLLLGENFLRLDERSEIVDGEKRDRFVNGEFQSDVAYACQVVVTNPTSSPRAVELLLQIPAGSVPVLKGFWTRGRSVELEPYSTRAIEYAFYFPASGDFAHYPVHASEKQALAGAGMPRTLHVVDTPAQLDTNSWEHVARSGSSAEVLAYVDAANLLRLDFRRIAWRLREREFFDALTAHLRTRHFYDDKTWSYGLFHGDQRVAREYLEQQAAFVSSCGAWLDSPLLRIDPLARNTYFHVELDPLVHARAHHRGALNVGSSSALEAQYRAFLDVLGHKPKLDARDWAMATYYFMLQDRVDEALAAFVKIDRAQLDSRLQYDYLGAYLCFFSGDLLRARALAEAHREHPVAHWRERFVELLGQLDEAAGKSPRSGGPQSQDQLAASEPALELAGEGRALALRYRNLAECELRFYPLDVEVAFSARPFAPAEGQAAAFVQPLSMSALNLPADKSELALELPEQFKTANVLVEVRAGGLTRARTLYANALDVRFLETYGQVAVADPRSGAPLPRVYVKCFARLADGTVRFHKDGYTDLRGRFDYASISGDPDLGAERYAVLVLSDALGADIRELGPPAR